MIFDLNPRLTDWTGRRVWIVGATAGIGEALARQLAAQGAILLLSGRNATALEALVRELGAAHRALPLDVTDAQALDNAFAQIDTGEIPLPDIALYLAGDYTPLHATTGEAALPIARQMLTVNYSAAVEWSMRLIPRWLTSGPSTSPRGLALVASVAGYTGLPKALAYGPSKAALIRFAECLHIDLQPHNLGVWIINPGFVATRLTAQNDFNMPALISPNDAASEIIQGFRSGAFEIHFPKRFTRIMKLLAHLPYGIALPLLRRLDSSPSPRPRSENQP